MLSLSLYLRLLGKKVYLIISTSIGENLDYLARIIEYNSIPVLRQVEEIGRIKDEVDAIIFCDTANTKLVPFYPYIRKHLLSRGLPVMEIDHHFGADSEVMTENGVTLFRHTNATTEIIGELLKKLFQKFPGRSHPLDQRNILICLLTGLLGDTAGGRAVPYRENYDYWIHTLGENLGKNTRWRKPNRTRLGDDRETKFGHPDELWSYLNRLSQEQLACLKTLKERIVIDGEIGSLNLLNSTYPQVSHVCRPYHSDWFTNMMGFLLNQISEATSKVGLVYYHGKNAEDHDCIYIKIRRSAKYSGIDLRHVEIKLRSAFDGMYMGGGGHAGAVSFRVHPHDENEFLTKFETVVNDLKKSLP